MIINDSIKYHSYFNWFGLQSYDDRITFFKAFATLEFCKQKKDPPLFHCESILFISPKQA